MSNLIYKEFRLVIHPFFFLIALFGALILIPNWVYLVALMYFLFIAIPNIFMNVKAQNDTGFSVLLPVRKSDVVKARVVSMSILEIVQVLVAAIFVAISIKVNPKGNFLIDANIAYLGCALVMYGLFNLIFFPMFYKTAHKIGVPLIVGFTAVFLYAGIIEVMVVAVPAVARVLDGVNSAALLRQIPVLAIAIALFAGLSWLAYRLAANNFEKVDL
jgi:ABC-2 type transport system permease protein